jgi:flavin reductase (DIM6/NTAB) family NADH-FMN oxidoreductase RutF
MASARTASRPRRRSSVAIPRTLARATAVTRRLRQAPTARGSIVASSSRAADVPVGFRARSAGVRPFASASVFCYTCAMPVARDEFFQIMSAFPTGVAIVTTVDADGTPRGLTTNSVTSISAEPPIVLVSVARDSRTLPALLASKRFVVNFMRHDCADVCRLFASRADDKFEQIAWTPGEGGVPILHEGAVAHAECTVIEELEIGDHIVLTGLVVAGVAPDPEDVPIVYFRKAFSAAPSI